MKFIFLLILTLLIPLKIIAAPCCWDGTKIDKNIKNIETFELEKLADDLDAERKALDIVFEEKFDDCYSDLVNFYEYVVSELRSRYNTNCFETEKTILQINAIVQ